MFKAPNENADDPICEDNSRRSVALLHTRDSLGDGFGAGPRLAHCVEMLSVGVRKAPVQIHSWLLPTASAMLNFPVLILPVSPEPVGEK